jgi:hypothetical protein
LQTRGKLIFERFAGSLSKQFLIVQSIADLVEALAECRLPVLSMI